MKDVTIIIKTFERHYCLEALLESYQQLSKSMGWSCPILIADDSKEPYEAKIKSKFGNLVTYYDCLPFNIGPSAGRNKLLERVEMPYFLLCDDDFIFDKRSDLVFLRNILKTTDIELIGGLFYNMFYPDFSKPKWRTLLRELRYGKFKRFWARLFNKEVLERFQGNYEVKDGILYAKPFSYKSPFTRCDFVHDFFMAETATLRKRGIKWNESMRNNEHEVFFIEAKQKGLQVATTEEVGIVHKQLHSTHYKDFRFLGDQLLSLAKHIIMLLLPLLIFPFGALGAAILLIAWGGVLVRYIYRYNRGKKSILLKKQMKVVESSTFIVVWNLFQLMLADSLAVIHLWLFYMIIPKWRHDW